MTPHQPRQQNTVSGTGIVVTDGVFSGSPITVVSGDGNVVTNQLGNTSDDEVLAAAQRNLSIQLAWIQEALLAHRDLASAADHEDAVQAVTALQADLGKPAVADQKTLRQRIKGVLGALQPVAEIIGGIAALEAIVRGL